MPTQSLGQIAYDAYGEPQAWRTFDGKLLPSFARTRPDIQRAWEAAGKAVAKVLKRIDAEETA